MTLALALLIALIAAGLVLEPVLRAAAGRPVAPPAPLFADSDDEDDPRRVRRDRALAALKEIEFDRATGKLSDQDYARMKSRFTAEAVQALRDLEDARQRGDAAPGRAPAPPRPDAAADAAVERLIARARAEGGPARRFCLECGAPLQGAGRFCLECGTPVAAGV